MSSIPDFDELTVTEQIQFIGQKYARGQLLTFVYSERQLSPHDFYIVLAVDGMFILCLHSGGKLQEYYMSSYIENCFTILQQTGK